MSSNGIVSQMNSPPLTSDPFVSAFGQPDEPASPMHFDNGFLEEVWTLRHARTGAGWFLGRFFYLLGDGLERLSPCLNAWSFLLAPDVNRRIIGLNVHGALLVIENEAEAATEAPVILLDPLTVTAWHNPQCVYTTLLAHWLPERRIPRFLDTPVYLQWLQTSGRLLADDEILGIRVPLSLGGRMELDNFAPLNIVSYYQAVGPVYAKAHAQLPQQPKDEG